MDWGGVVDAGGEVGWVNAKGGKRVVGVRAPQQIWEIDSFELK